MIRGIVTGIDRDGQTVDAVLDDGQEIEAAYAGDPPWPTSVALFEGGPSWVCAGVLGNKRSVLHDDFLRSAQPIGSELVYAESSSTDQTITTSTITDVTGATVTFTAIKNAVYHCFPKVNFQIQGASDRWSCFVREGSTTIDYCGDFRERDATLSFSRITFSSIVRYVPTTSGSKTLKLSVQRTFGTAGNGVCLNSDSKSQLLIVRAK